MPITGMANEPPDPIGQKRWIQLVAGLLAMVMVSNYLYAFALFEPDIQKQFAVPLPLVAAIFSICVFFGAWQTRRSVQEMQRDRRRQFLENALEKAYSPIFEVFRRALVDATRPRGATSSFRFTIDEIN